MRRSRPSRDHVRQFRGIPIQEAKASIHVQPNDSDIKGATKESPDNCAYARCLKRNLDAANVFVFKTVAYVESLNERGQTVMLRYIVKTYARDYLLRFDHGERVAPGGFVFHRPNKCLTLNYKQKDGHRRYAEGKRSPRLTKPGPKKPKEYELRNGKGRVHLFCGEDQIKVRKA